MQHYYSVHNALIIVGVVLCLCAGFGVPSKLSLHALGAAAFMAAFLF